MAVVKVPFMAVVKVPLTAVVKVPLTAVVKVPLTAVIKFRSRLLLNSAHGCYQSVHLLLSWFLCLILVSLILNSLALDMLTLRGFTIDQLGQSSHLIGNAVRDQQG